MDTVVRQIDRELEKLAGKAEREQAAAQAKIAPIKDRIERLTKARGVLVDGVVVKPKRARSASSGRAKAGPAAIEAVEKALDSELRGLATQAALTKATGLNSGQVSAAMKDLEERGVVRRTGRKEGRSPEFEKVPVAA